MGNDRQPGGTAFALRDPLPWADFREIVHTGEELEYEAVFLPEIAGRDSIATLAMLAGETDRVRLATGVIPIQSRTPLLTAMGAATVQERSAGRMILGLGTGPATTGALDRLRARVLDVRALLQGERRDSEALSLRPGAPPPIWIAALGPRALRLAGEIADGVLLNWCPPERVSTASALVREGAESAGRAPSDVTIGVYVRACIGPEEGIAMPALRAAAGEYASYRSYRRQLEEVGLGHEAGLAAKAFLGGRPQEVPDALVRAVCLFGGAEAARARLAEYRRAGADLPVVYPVVARDAMSSIMSTLFALGPSPAVES